MFSAVIRGCTHQKNKKESSHASRVLKVNYVKHGLPDRIQSDRGSKFEGKVRLLYKKLEDKTN